MDFTKPMNPELWKVSGPTPKEAWAAEERAAWDGYASFGLQLYQDRAKMAGDLADAMLLERRKRFPGPK